MNFYYRSRWHWWRRGAQRRTRRTIKNNRHQFGIFLQFSATNIPSRLNLEKCWENNKITNQIFRQIVMRQKNLPSSTTTNLRRCVLHEKKQIKTFERSRVCFPVRDFPPNFFLFANNGRGTLPPPLLSMPACLPRPSTMNPPSVIFGWENKWLMRYSCHFPVILFYFFLSSMNM